MIRCSIGARVWDALPVRVPGKRRYLYDDVIQEEGETLGEELTVRDLYTQSPDVSTFQSNRQIWAKLSQSSHIEVEIREFDPASAELHIELLRSTGAKASGGLRC